MNKFLLLLALALWALPGLAQNKANPLVQIRETPTSTPFYSATATVASGTYALTSAGQTALEADAKAGKFLLKVNCGGYVASIPVGTRPGRTSPCVSQTGTSGPAWLAAIYSQSGNTLSIEAKRLISGIDVELKMERVDGVSFILNNPDNFSVQSGAWLGHGTTSSNYPDRWQVNGMPYVPLKLSFRQKVDVSQVYSYTFTPVANATNVILFGSNSSPPTSTTSTSTTVAAFSQVAEAESGTGSGSTFSQSGASGGSMKNGPDVTYSITSVPAAGTYTMVVGYLSGGANVTASLSVNGTSQDSFTLLATDGSLGSKTTTVNLVQGTNLVKLAGSFAQDKILVSRAGSVVTVPTTPTTTYKWALFGGNSLTQRPSDSSIGWPYNWGMAASSQANDYAHRIITAMLPTNPGMDGFAFSGFSFFEQNYLTWTPSDYDTFIFNPLAAHYGSNKIDWFYLSIGENVNPDTYNSAVFKAKLDYIFSRLQLATGAKILVRNSIWTGHDAVNADLQAYASLHNYTFVDMSGIRERADYKASSNVAPAPVFSNAGVARHFNDAGMLAMANLTLTQLGLATINPTTPPSTGSDGFNYPLPTTAGTWDGYNSTNLNGFTVGPVISRESTTLRIELRKDWGGALQIYDKLANNRPIINFNDHGRESELTLYSGPSNYSQDMGGTWLGIGWNPITVGNDAGASSVGGKIIAMGQVTDANGNVWDYLKVQMVSWPHIPVRYLEVYNEKWTRIVGDDEVRVKFRVAMFRDDKTFYEVGYQEWPVFMFSGNTKNAYFYNGNAPFTGAGYTTTNMIDRVATQTVTYGNDTYQPGQQIEFRQTPFHVSEPWQAVDTGPGRKVGVWAPTYYSTTNQINLWNYDQGDGEASNPLVYVTNNLPKVLDSDGVYTGEYGYKLSSSVDAIRSWANSQPRPIKPDFRFSVANGRCDWFPIKGYDQKEPFTSDNWKVTFTGSDGNGVQSKLMSPVQSWKASDSPVIYVKMKYTGAATQMYLTWLITGQQADQEDPNFPNMNNIRNPNHKRVYGQQRMSFNLTKNGQFVTYAIPVSTHSQWTNTIQQLELGYDLTGSLPPGDQVEIVYIGANNPDN